MGQNTDNSSSQLKGIQKDRPLEQMMLEENNNQIILMTFFFHVYTRVIYDRKFLNKFK